EMLNVVGLRSVVPVDPSIFSFSLAGIGLAYGLFKQSLIESLPATREAVVEGMNDGWMVVNAKGIIVDLNPAAERVIGLPREKAHGQPLHSVLPDLPTLTPGADGVQELEMKRSFRSHEGWRFLNIRVSSLADARKEQFGHLIVWRDITERRMAEEARQRARDEMFVLINAISSEASQALNLEDFLSESILQIIYPFRSQMVAIFVAEEKKQEESAERDFRLLAHFGLPSNAADITPALPPSSPVLASPGQSHAPRLIEDPSLEPELPAILVEAECACLLAVPLVTQDGDENRVIGCMFVGRKEKPVYSQDEAVRLGTIGDHLANLISSERRRKLAISLSVRQRLLRDLHDSVSQKLYGLVYMTEAAQAALEAGTTVDPAQILSRIGENARQAVREMRLFLFQMQSIDVEKEGLIAPLQYRLSAVEGRANTKARLLADENISLSMEKQVELYFIAQEALNNALRHAAAKNVLVRVKQGRRNVILEIQDDGCGFDPRHVDGGGVGLASMRERASKIRGTLRIQSKPEQGTRVIVTVPRDQPVTQPRRRR
ncbi:MAG TPA: ATP-binding protein, partial [Anaerolineales bacterium]